jgi:hypothetical protein
MMNGTRTLVVVLLTSMTACPANPGEGTTENPPSDETTAEATSTGLTEDTTAGPAEGTSTAGTEGTTEDPAEGTSTEGTEGTTGEPSDDGVVEACGLPSPCGEFVWECVPFSEGYPCDDVAYSDALVCMLETMAAGEQAQFVVSFNGLVTGEVEWVDVAVLGADEGVYQRGLEDPLDFSISWDPAQRCALRPAEFFEACLADAGDAMQHSACMSPYDWFEEGCAESLTCP